MARLIMKFPHFSSGSGHAAHLTHYIRYMATRPGVVKLGEERRQQPATLGQTDLIQRLLMDFPDAVELLEYQDYLKNPTVGNASEFIFSAMEYNFDVVGKRENYVDYIAHRPRVVTEGSHGLFTKAGEQVMVTRVAETVASHPGVVWTPIISLRREDADRLGYSQLESWKQLLRSSADQLASAFKIAPGNFCWYAALHDEGHHPHIHMVCYSTKEGEGFVTVAGMEQAKSLLARQIFRDDLTSIYQQHTRVRDALSLEAEAQLAVLCKSLQTAACTDMAIIEQVAKLQEGLQAVKGKKVYGYLPPQLKQQVNAIVDALAQLPGMAELYDSWWRLRLEVLGIYQTTDKLEKPPLSQQQELKKIRNLVIQAALGQVDLETEPPDKELVGEEDYELEVADVEKIFEEQAAECAALHANWTQQYQVARRALFGGKGKPPDFASAHALLLAEANIGNALAMHDLGRVYGDGLGMEPSPEQSYGWYEKALAAFLRVEADKSDNYLQYRIGKMYARGQGTEKDFTSAASWFAKAANQGNKYAQYSLAGLYDRGEGVPQDLARATELYTTAHNQDFPYASYELAKRYRDGFGARQDASEADACFADAYHGFCKLESKTPDDQLQYRIGCMLFKGQGVAVDVPKAIQYFQLSARLGNSHAQYQLAKLYLKAEDTDPAKVQEAIEWLEKAAANENPQAQYALGKLYRDGNYVAQSETEALRLFHGAATQGNQYAQYALGKLLLRPNMLAPDIPAAVHWLEQAAQQNNAYAQYTLGQLFLKGEDVRPDAQKGIYWLERSAVQGSEFAQYRLGKVYLLGEQTQKDVPQAVEWLRRAAIQKNQFALYTLGRLYLRGEEVPQDKDYAAECLGLAAMQGNIYAQWLLDNQSHFQRTTAMTAATRMLNSIAALFESQELPRLQRYQMEVDSRRRRKINQRAGRRVDLELLYKKIEEATL